MCFVASRNQDGGMIYDTGIWFFAGEKVILHHIEEERLGNLLSYEKGLELMVGSISEALMIVASGFYHIDSRTEAYYKQEEEEDFDKPFDDIRPRNDRIRCVAYHDLDTNITYWTSFTF